MSHAARPPEDDMLDPTLQRRFGFRGKALTRLGVVWLLVGLSVLLAPVRDADNLIALEQLPVWLRVGLWWAPAVVAFVTAWWPAGADKIGFMALVVPAALRALSYLWTAVVGTFSDVYGDTGMWTAAIAWVVITDFVILLAAWPEQVDPAGTDPKESA